jgi:oxygen-independent coproporphyrinogen-3 oxidase
VPGIYVHVPFCVRKCAYCDFYSVPAEEGLLSRYASLLPREADALVAAHPHLASPADTVFFGGGTPTVLGAQRLCALLSTLGERFPIAEEAEVTVEANPGTVDAPSLLALRRGGFNRVSLGVQSFHPDTLSFLGRLHDGTAARDAVRDARRAGFPSVGIDLIFAHPGQTLAEWNADLERAILFLPDHLSVYAYTPAEGTPMGDAVAKGDLRLPPDEEAAAMYELASEKLTGEGYGQYEVSNFALPGKECRHNGKYWAREEVAALGPAAHGLLFPPGSPHGVRTEAPEDLSAWSRAVGEGRLPWVEEPVVLSADDAWREALVAGLRRLEGVGLAELRKRYGPPSLALRGAVDSLVASGRLVLAGGRLRIPEGFLFVSNEALLPLA